MANPNLEAKLLRALRGQKMNPISPRELSRKVGVRKANRAEIQAMVDEMKQSGRLIEKDGKLILAENLGLVEGTVVKVNATFGFARPDKSDSDVFVAGRKLLGALPGDRVLLRILDRKNGDLPEGEVYKVTQEAKVKFSGVLQVLPDDMVRVMPDRYVRFPFWVNPRHLMGAKDGDKVLCEVTRRGERHGDHRARILETFGSADSAAACCGAILSANGIIPPFPPEVLEQAVQVSENGIHPKEIEKRLDLRDEVIFTIDGADSKDLDDAISIARCEDGGWELGVHIADVSEYVLHQSALDKEAFARGTSVYYADSVVPMLPPELSNGICSLNPGEDRLAFSALMQLDAQGKCIAHRFVKTVIRSRVKGIYHEVNAILDDTADAAVREKYSGLEQAIADMHELAELLRARRFARGGVNLESTESKLTLNELGICIDVQPRARGVAENIIEEFMLMANEAAATFALEEKIPFVYRVHDDPSPDKVHQLYDVLEQLGVKVVRPKDGVTPQQIAEVLTKIEDTPMQTAVNTMVLRTMAKAKYSERCTGHFGLAMHNYTHFTSPIRRYSDLTIHRIMSSHLGGMKKMNLERKFEKFVAEAALQASERELAAMNAERDCEACYKAEMVGAHIGEEFDGAITSVVPYGLYVQLDNTVEGLIPVGSLPGGEWQPDGVLAMVERTTGRKLSLGAPVRVKVTGSDVSAGTVDLELV